MCAKHLLAIGICLLFFPNILFHIIAVYYRNHSMHKVSVERFWHVFGLVVNGFRLLLIFEIQVKFSCATANKMLASI